jgi:hypothetical protein
MRYGFCIAAMAAGLLAAPAFAGPQSTEFSSQGVTIDGPGVGIHVGPEHRHWRDRDHRWHEREVRGNCKTVTVKERAPDGSMISKTRTNC